MVREQQEELRWDAADAAADAASDVIMDSLLTAAFSFLSCQGAYRGQRVSWELGQTLA